jgi:hercynylcysteine S-oxide lyase
MESTTCPNSNNGLLLLGKSLLQNGTFQLRPGLVNLNHGSFGTVPLTVFNEQCRLLREQESCPEVWFRETYYRYIDISRQQVAALINARVEDVVLVENASYAVNSILRSFPFKVSQFLVLIAKKKVFNPLLLSF